MQHLKTKAKSVASLLHLREITDAVLNENSTLDSILAEKGNFVRKGEHWVMRSHNNKADVLIWVNKDNLCIKGTVIPNLEDDLPSSEDLRSLSLKAKSIAAEIEDLARYASSELGLLDKATDLMKEFSKIMDAAARQSRVFSCRGVTLTRKELNDELDLSRITDDDLQRTAEEVFRRLTEDYGYSPDEVREYGRHEYTSTDEALTTLAETLIRDILVTDHGASYKKTGDAQTDTWYLYDDQALDKRWEYLVVCTQKEGECLRDLCRGRFNGCILCPGRFVHDPAETWQDPYAAMPMISFNEFIKKQPWQER
ncbi:MAG: hypothetical protein IJ504_01020 [Bacteroidales bacterium]|nr:hypothetical protein [Bacteroidales bacterium]